MARKKRMQSAPDRLHPSGETQTQAAVRMLQFVLAFSYEDLAKAPAEYFVTLKTDFERLLIAEHLLYGLAPPLVSEYQLKDFLALQWDTKDLLTQIVDSRKADGFPRTIGLPRTGKLIPISYSVGVTVFGEQSFSVARGAVRDLFLVMVHRLFTLLPHHQIVQCPECLELFYRAGKQIYCCKDCSLLTRQKRFVAKQEGLKNSRRMIGSQL